MRLTNFLVFLKIKFSIIFVTLALAGFAAAFPIVYSSNEGNWNGNLNQGVGNGNLNGSYNKGVKNGNDNGNANKGWYNGNSNGNGNTGKNSGNDNGNANKGVENGNGNYPRHLEAFEKMLSIE